MTEREFGGLKVVLTGGRDGQGGGDGPLVVLLHGYGAPGRDLVPLSQVLSVPAGTRFAFPAAPLSLGPNLGPAFLQMFDSRAWWHIDIERFERALGGLGQGTTRPDLTTPALQALIRDVPDGLAEARERVLAALDQLEKELNVPAGQIVLGGFSQGSMLSLDVALRSNRPLAGLVLFSTTLLCKDEWLPRMSTRAGLRVFQSHGQLDPLLPFFLADLVREELTRAGLSVDFVPFRGAHEIPQASVRGAGAFLQSVLAPQIGGMPGTHHV